MRDPLTTPKQLTQEAAIAFGVLFVQNMPRTCIGSSLFRHPLDALATWQPALYHVVLTGNFDATAYTALVNAMGRQRPDATDATSFVFDPSYSTDDVDLICRYLNNVADPRVRMPRDEQLDNFLPSLLVVAAWVWCYAHSDEYRRIHADDATRWTQREPRIYFDYNRCTLDAIHEFIVGTQSVESFALYTSRWVCDTLDDATACAALIATALNHCVSAVAMIRMLGTFAGVAAFYSFSADVQLDKLKRWSTHRECPSPLHAAIRPVCPGAPVRLHRKSPIHF